jgi:hypothetical protein
MLDAFGNPTWSGKLVFVEFFCVNMQALKAGPLREGVAKEHVVPPNESLGVNDHRFVSRECDIGKGALSGLEQRLKDSKEEDFKSWVSFHIYVRQDDTSCAACLTRAGAVRGKLSSITQRASCRHMGLVLLEMEANMMHFVNKLQNETVIRNAEGGYGLLVDIPDSVSGSQ